MLLKSEIRQYLFPTASPGVLTDVVFPVLWVPQFLYQVLYGVGRGSDKA
jgi:hypothetical protein